MTWLGEHHPHNINIKQKHIIFPGPWTSLWFSLLGVALDLLHPLSIPSSGRPIGKIKNKIIIHSATPGFWGVEPSWFPGWWYTYLPLWKIMEWKSVGMMTFPTEWKIKTMFQTTNQFHCLFQWTKCTCFAIANLCSFKLPLYSAKENLNYLNRTPPVQQFRPFTNYKSEITPIYDIHGIIKNHL